MASRDAHTPRPTARRGLQILVPRDAETPELTAQQLLALWGLKHVVWRFWKARFGRKTMQNLEDRLRDRINRVFDGLGIPREVTGFIAQHGPHSSVKLQRVPTARGNKFQNPAAWLDYLGEHSDVLQGVTIPVVLLNQKPIILTLLSMMLTEQFGAEVMNTLPVMIDREKLRDLIDRGELGETPEGLVTDATLGTQITPFLWEGDKWRNAS